MKNKASILISSTDSYNDCWEPFFNLFEKNFSDISNYNIYLISDTKTYEGHDFVKNITVSKNGRILSWSDRMLKALDQIDSEVIFLLFDDYFLMSMLNNNKFIEFENLMYENKNIANLRLVHKTNSFPSSFNNLYQLKNISSYKNSLQPGFWRKQDLINLIQKGESPWQFELLGTIRAFFYPKLFLVVSNQLSGKIYDTMHYGAIIKGNWISSEYEKIKKLTGLSLKSNRNITVILPNKNNFLRKLKLLIQITKNKKYILKSIIFLCNNIINRMNFKIVKKSIYFKE
jgi:hypothetical protein|tara:strand:+ start:4034 stop:4894 length:861 start_codon:yes stop_codon:yes gene_type:complete